jgi:hypothetical protein
MTLHQKNEKSMMFKDQADGASYRYMLRLIYACIIIFVIITLYYFYSKIKKLVGLLHVCQCTILITNIFNSLFVKIIKT